MNNNFNNEYPKNDFIEKKKPENNNKKIYYIGNAIFAAVYIICCTFNFKLNFMASNAILPAVYLVSAFPMLFVFVGWWLFIYYPESLKKKREKCTQTVLALLRDYKVVVHHDEDGTSYTYYAIYEFEWNNVSHRVISKEMYVGKREKAIQCKLLINPNNPSEIYEIENENVRIKSNKGVGIVIMVLGLFFFFM